jgi:hypothetical protein
MRLSARAAAEVLLSFSAKPRILCNSSADRCSPALLAYTMFDAQSCLANSSISEALPNHILSPLDLVVADSVLWIPTRIRRTTKELVRPLRNTTTPFVRYLLQKLT